MALTPQDIAASCYRAYTGALGIADEWDGLSLDCQAPWLVLAHRAPRLFEAQENQPWGLVAKMLFISYVACGEQQGEQLWLTANSLPERLAWEAVARHFVTLLEADDVTDLAALERSWAGWVQKQLKGETS